MRNIVLGPGNYYTRPPRLSPRELEVLTWVKRGKSNSQIGEILGVSKNTVKNHIASILKRLGASNRVGAVSRAVEWRMI